MIKICSSMVYQTPTLPPALNLPVDVALPFSTSIITSTSCACALTPLNLPSLVVWYIKMNEVFGFILRISSMSLTSRPALDTLSMNTN